MGLHEQFAQDHMGLAGSTGRLGNAEESENWAAPLSRWYERIPLGVLPEINGSSQYHTCLD
jgi:hypothetical protein